jgi:hypothetical protein
MKRMSIRVREDIYKAFKRHADSQGRSVAAVIREAMSLYYANHVPSERSIFDIEPIDLGRTRRDLSPDDDLLEEMLHDKRF